MFRLKLFGSAGIQGPGGPVSGRAVQRRRIGLLALLAVARDRGVSRDKLIGLLWPDAEADRARPQLSDSVYRINQAVHGEGVVATGNELRLNPARLPSDAWEFATAIEQGAWQRAVELHAAPFLDGFFLTDCDELEHWVDAQRERFRRDYARAVEALADAADRAGALADAVRWWRTAAAHDPYSTRVAVRLMRALERDGERAAAVRHADEHAALVERELGVAPDTELLMLAEALRAPSRVPGAGPRPNPRTVAVLPFVNLGADPDNDYFADGITEDVIAHLSRVAALNVISRSSVMLFRNRTEGLREIGARLGAATLLDGSVRCAGDRVRIVVQLVEAETDQCLWGETYDRQITDVFAIQTDVALHIAAALHARLSPEERTRIRKEPTLDLDAYQLYQQGRACFVRYTTEWMLHAIEYFEQAIERDPGYALAHAGIAMAYTELAEGGLLEPEQALLRARTAAIAALALDGELAEAHCMLGHLNARCDFDWAGAEREFKRALELSPGAADTWDLYGRLCASLERYDEALVMLQRAQQLDPLAHRTDVASMLIRAGRYDEALAAASRAVAFDPQYARGRATLGWAYLKKGMVTEGLRELEHAVALAPDSPQWLAGLGQGYAEAGQPERAREVLERLEAMSRERYVSPYHYAYVYTGLGEPDRAIDFLERAYRERAGAVYGIKGSFLFAPLRPHPRFAALLRRMNLG